MADNIPSLLYRVVRIADLSRSHPLQPAPTVHHDTYMSKYCPNSENILDSSSKCSPTENVRTQNDSTASKISKAIQADQVLF